MNFIENRDKKCPGARRTFSLLFCQTFRLNFRLFCDNPCYSNINPGAFQNLSTLSEQNLSLIASKSLWHWFLKSCVWPKNLNIISHGLRTTNENFCDNFASGQKKKPAERKSWSSLGPAGCWFWIKILLFWCQDRQGGLPGGRTGARTEPGNKTNYAWCGEHCWTTQAQETSDPPLPLPGEMTWWILKSYNHL